MSEKKAAEAEEQPKKASKVVKKSALAKGHEKTAELSEKQLKDAEDLLFGGEAGKPEEPKKKGGIIRKSASVKAAEPSAAAAKAAEFKKIAVPSKTRIVKKKAEPVPPPEAPKTSEPVHAAPEAERSSAVAKMEEKRKLAQEKKDDEARGKKRPDDRHREPERARPQEPKFTTSAEESIKVISAEDEKKVKVLSYKEALEKAPGPDEEYEEVEEIVEEVIEEVEYEEEPAPAVAPVVAKHKPGGIPDFGDRSGPRRRRRKKRKTPADAVAAKDAVKRTLAQINISNVGGRKRYRKEENAESVSESTNILPVGEFMSVSELANAMNLKSAEVIAACMKLGIMVTINQRLDFDTTAAVVDEFGFKAELMEEYTEETLLTEEKDDPKDLVRRPPIVTVMGHVDHGKTSLLDHIRKTNVVSGEAGGITQHIGAYRVTTTHGPVAFLDTPGHEAFATMRARGANITDLVILVVAADSNVMPQTIESIDHAKAAGVPLVVAINKMDLPTANAANIKNQLAHHGVIVESFGGKTVAVEISCKTGQNIDRLLEVVAIEAELLELKANPARKAEGAIIESKLDSRLGVVATVLITNGTLHRGDNFVTGPYAGRVKVMTDEFGRRIDEAGPSHPVQVLGLSGTPRAGDSFVVVDNEHMAREISVKRSQVEKEREQRQIKHMSLDELYSQIKLGGVRDVNLVIKGDVDGSVEALSDALQKLSTPTIKINIVHKSVGAIKESDILLAAATNAVIIGFHIYPNSKVRELAVSEGVDIRIYKIIYEAVEEMQKAMEGMLVPVEKEVVLGNAEIRDVFKISKVGSVAGCYVVSGLIRRASKVRILRDGKPVIETKIASLKRIKDDASEVQKGFECGIFLENYNDIKKGDIIEAFEMQQVQAQK